MQKSGRFKAKHRSNNKKPTPKGGFKKESELSDYLTISAGVSV
jgi:hypothetical protein